MSQIALRAELSVELYIRGRKLGKGREDFMKEAALCSASGGVDQALRYKEISFYHALVCYLCTKQYAARHQAH